MGELRKYSNVKDKFSLKCLIKEPENELSDICDGKMMNCGGMC